MSKNTVAAGSVVEYTVTITGGSVDSSYSTVEINPPLGPGTMQLKSAVAPCRIRTLVSPFDGTPLRQIVSCEFANADGNLAAGTVQEGRFTALATRPGTYEAYAELQWLLIQSDPVNVEVM